MLPRLGKAYFPASAAASNIFNVARLRMEFRIDLNKISQMCTTKAFTDMVLDERLNFIDGNSSPTFAMRLNVLPKSHLKATKGLPIHNKVRRKAFRQRLLKTITGIKSKKIENFIRQVDEIFHSSAMEEIDEMCESTVDETLSVVDNLVERRIKDFEQRKRHAEGPPSKSRTNYHVNCIIKENFDFLTTSIDNCLGPQVNLNETISDLVMANCATFESMIKEKSFL